MDDLCPDDHAADAEDAERPRFRQSVPVAAGLVRSPMGRSRLGRARQDAAGDVAGLSPVVPPGAGDPRPERYARHRAGSGCRNRHAGNRGRPRLRRAQSRALFGDRGQRALGGAGADRRRAAARAPTRIRRRPSTSMRWPACASASWATAPRPSTMRRRRWSMARGRWTSACASRCSRRSMRTNGWRRPVFSAITQRCPISSAGASCATSPA